MIGQIGEEQGVLDSLFQAKPMRKKLEKAIELEPDYADSYDVMARLYMALPGWSLSFGNKNTALEYRLKSIELEPNNFDFQWRLYENYKELKEDDKARDVLEEIITIPIENYRGETPAREIKEKAQKVLNDL